MLLNVELNYFLNFNFKFHFEREDFKGYLRKR
jgi:hypothetical protein